MPSLIKKAAVGKTTTSISLAAGLAMEGEKVLLIDPLSNIGKTLSKHLAEGGRMDTIWGFFWRP